MEIVNNDVGYKTYVEITGAPHQSQSDSKI